MPASVETREFRRNSKGSYNQWFAWRLHTVPTMITINAIALSSVNAATLRLQATASNIANMRSNGAAPGAAGPAAFTPVEVEQTATGYGGVDAKLAPAAREALLAHDPSAPYANGAGFVAAPDVDLAGEFLQLMTAKPSFAANLQVLRTSDEMLGDVLSIIA